MSREPIFPPATHERYDRLSAAARELLEHVEAHPEMLERASFAALDVRDDFVRYPLLHWPLFVDASVARQLHAVMDGLSRLVRRVPTELLGGDPARIAAVYGMPERDARLMTTLLESRPLVDGMLARGDFVLAEDGLRCLELNFDSNLGGWQSDHFAGLYRRVPALGRFFDALGRPARCPSAPRALFDHLVGSFLEHHPLEHGHLGLVFVKADDKDVERLRRDYDAAMGRHYAEVLEAHRPGLDGRVTFCRYGDLAERGGHLFLDGVDGRPVQIVVEQCRGHVARPVFVAWLAGKALVLNGPLSHVFDDKRNLALLCEHAAELDDDDRRLVERHLPWTRHVRRGFVDFEGERRALPDLLAAERRRFVLKSARGKAGDEVRVGRVSDDEAWRRAVDHALGAGDWIVQEFVDSLPFEARAGERGRAAHDVVWGLFLFGRTWGGGFLRSRRRDDDGRAGGAPINSAQGSVNTVLFEVDDRPGEPVRRPLASPDTPRETP